MVAMLDWFPRRIQSSRNETSTDAEDPNRGSNTSPHVLPVDPFPFEGIFHRDSQDLVVEPGFLDLFGGVLIAYLAGASLVVPMVIMSLGKSLHKSLITTSVFVCLLALILSMIGLKYGDVITSTFAYAAVLVVFVGVST